MSEADHFRGRRYEIVAFAHGEKPVYYEEFGHEEENGAWLLVSRGKTGFAVYRGELGYCTYRGCANRDAFDDEFERSGVTTHERAFRFIRRQNYVPFVVIPEGAMRRLCEERTLVQVLPANLRTGRYRDLPFPPSEQAAQAIITAVKLEMEWPLVFDDVLTRNQELCSRAVDAFGVDRLVKDAGAEVLDRDRESKLLRVQDMVFVYVREASTPRRYLLRVPPETRTVREAIAWTFGFTEPGDYPPIREA